MSILIGMLLGVGMGIFSGLGVGGGKLLIPVLVFIFGLQQQSAQGVALMSFLPIASIAAVIHYKEGNVDVPTAYHVVIGALVGAVAGAWAATSLSNDWLKRAYGFFLMGIAIYEFFDKEGTELEDKGPTDQ